MCLKKFVTICCYTKSYPAYLILDADNWGAAGKTKDLAALLESAQVLMMIIDQQQTAAIVSIASTRTHILKLSPETEKRLWGCQPRATSALISSKPARCWQCCGSSCQIKAAVTIGKIGGFDHLTDACLSKQVETSDWCTCTVPGLLE